MESSSGKRPPISRHALAIRLNDHSAAMMGKADLVRRISRENRDAELAVFRDDYVIVVDSQRQIVGRLLEPVDCRATLLATMIPQMISHQE